MRVLGAVLAGGASSRFGSDKAMAVLGGRTLLEHSRALLAEAVDEVIVVGRGDIIDRPCARLGPLGGIAGALDHARRHGFDSVLTVACDMIRLPEGLLEALLGRVPAYCADAPVLGHWPTGLTATLLDRLAGTISSSRPHAPVGPWTPGQARGDGGAVGSARHSRDPSLSVRRWAIDIGAIAIASSAPIANINTPADLAAL